MAPKGKEPEKPGQRRISQAKPDKKDEPTSMFLSVKVRDGALTVATGMLFLSLLAFVLYEVQRNKIHQIRGAVASIRGVLTYHNDSFRNMNDLEILSETKHLLKRMAKANRLSETAMEKTRTVFKLVNDGWISFHGYLYFFSDADDRNYEVAKRDCRKRKTQLVYITSAREEFFLEHAIKAREKYYWIGLEKTEGYWQWVTGENLSFIKFWDTDEPLEGSPHTKMCAELQNCNNNLKCWFSALCNETKDWICKMEPDPQLMHIP